MSNWDDGRTARDIVLRDVLSERDRQQRCQLAMADGLDTFYKQTTRNDWVAYLNAYTGRAAQNVTANQRSGSTFRESLVYAAGLCLTAIEAHDRGYC